MPSKEYLDRVRAFQKGGGFGTNEAAPSPSPEPAQEESEDPSLVRERSKFEARQAKAKQDASALDKGYTPKSMSDVPAHPGHPGDGGKTADPGPDLEAAKYVE